MRIWKLPLSSQRRPDFVLTKGQESEFKNQGKLKTELARKFCFENGWVGIGWGLNSLKTDLDDHNEYVRLLESSPQDTGEFTISVARQSCVSLASSMQIDDLVWCRSAKGVFWLGRIRGPWRYFHDGDFAKYDLYQVRKCDWIQVGSGDEVPGLIRNLFSGPGMAISECRTNLESAALFSKAIWNESNADKYSLPSNPALVDVLGILGADELEDVVGLYLQVECGWHIVPSTAKRTSPFTEFVLRDRNGKRAFVQVKSGKTTYDEETLPAKVDKFFIFYPRASSGLISSNEKVEYLQRSLLESFIQENKWVVPPRVRLLLTDATHPPSARR